MGQCINCKNLQHYCEENEVDSADIFKSQDICDNFIQAEDVLLGAYKAIVEAYDDYPNPEKHEIYRKAKSYISGYK